jgi:hypothetical protein
MAGKTTTTLPVRQLMIKGQQLLVGVRLTFDLPTTNDNQPYDIL